MPILAPVRDLVVLDPYNPRSVAFQVQALTEHILSLPALRESSMLDRSAQGWTNTMVATGAFTHGANFAGRISAVGFAWSSAGENIATGFLTPRAVVSGWMGSTGHCQNILNPTYTNVGTGVVHRAVGVGGNGATWTQDFALASRRRAPSHNFGPANGCPY